MRYTAAELAHHLQGTVLGDGGMALTGFAPANNARAGDLTFAENETYFALAEQSAASAILIDKEFCSPTKVLIRVKQARVAFATVLGLFFPETTPAPGIHATAVVATTAKVDPLAHIGPHCVLGEGVQIGPRTILVGGNHLGEGCRIGADCKLFANAVLYDGTRVGDRVRIHSGSVLGSDGFGYVLDGEQHRKVPQIGTVIVHDDVEIGANVTVDRGALGPTVIGRGSKIDNLVMIAHNVAVGEHCLLIAQSGIAGSTSLGNYVTIAGQAGLAGHLKIGNKVTVAAQSGIMQNIAEGEKWFGSPALPDRQMKRQILASQQLPELLRRMQSMEKRLQELEGKQEPAA